MLQRSAPVFVGRDRELAALAQAMADPPVVVLVEGEAGIGKSRLVREFLNTGGGGRALIACSPPFRHPHTLSPVVDAVKQAIGDVRDLLLGGLTGALRPLFPEWADDLPADPEPVEDATAARHRVFRALAELFEQIGVDTLILEDAHWSDEATLEFLVFLAASPHPVNLLVTCRPEDVPSESLLPRLARFATGGRRLSLIGLDESSTARLVSSMLDGSSVSDEFAAFLCQRTGGVPLSVEESVRLMVDRGDIFLRDGALARRPLAELAVPPTVRDLVLERVRRLGREAVAVLWAAAVFAEPIGERMLRSVCGLTASRVRQGMGEVLDCGLLVEDQRGGPGAVSFRHALACLAVYEEIPAPQRRILHLRAGRALEHDAPRAVARLATHFRHAGDRAKWCEYAEQAADIALTPGDEATASELLHELVVHAELPSRTVARLTRKIWFRTPSGDGRVDELVAALRSVLDRRDLSRGEDAEVRAQLGRLLGVREDFEAAYAELERAAPHLPKGSLAAARVMTYLSWPLGAIRPVAVHLRWLRRASEVTESLEPAERLSLHVDRAFALVTLGEEDGWAECERVPQDAASAPERLVLAIGHMNIGEIAMTWGRYAEARRRFGHALELAERDQHSRCRTIILMQQSRLDWLTGNWAGLLERAVALAGNEELAAVSRLEVELIIGLLHAATGAKAEAEEILLRAHADLHRQAALDCVASAAALARLHLADGDVAEALQVTEAPMEIVAGKGFWVHGGEVLPLRVAALIAAGMVPDATELVSAFADGLRGRNAPAPQIALAECRSMLGEARGEFAEAADGFAETATAWQALPRPYDAWLARERQARCLFACDRPEEALPLLTEAWQSLTELGASADADRLAQELRSHGAVVHKPWKGGRRGYGDQLSPRELEVVQRVVAGHSTREIARQLSRSPDTVYSQVRSAMRKLDVPSRTALAVRAAELGIAASFTT